MPVLASIISDFWHDQLVANGEQALFLVLVGFIGAFGFIRMSTRIMRSPRITWWPGSVVSEGGVHVHHLAFGICMMLAGGALGFAFYYESPWLEISALIFGIGGGLTIDEFALWIYLDDVYWSEEGRASIDATVIAVAAMGLVLLGVRPFDVETDTVVDAIVSAVTALFVFSVVAICFAKQRMLHGTIGFFVWVVALYGAVRIGKPGSPWAKRFYGERNPEKQAKATDRFRPDRRTERFKEAFRDAVGGAPAEAYERKIAERNSTREATAEVRSRAERAASADQSGRGT
jgi:nitrate reductase NapE component